jgi:hypothetical protein
MRRPAAAASRRAERRRSGQNRRKSNDAVAHGIGAVDAQEGNGPSHDSGAQQREDQVRQHGEGAKTRFSELAAETTCNQEYAGCLKQRLDDEADAVIAQSETPVVQHPGDAALDRPAPLSQP